MGRTLRYIGVFVLAVAAWLLLAESFGWIPERYQDLWVLPAVYTGIVCLLAGILLGVLAPVGRRLRKTRCVRCDAPIERGQTYCLDHLQQTLNEYRDRGRQATLEKEG